VKERIKALVSSFIAEVLDKDCVHFSISKERLCNEILFKFSVKFRSNYDDDLIFDDKEYLQFALNAKNKRYYGELLQESGETNESQLIRDIFSYYATLPAFLREYNIYREKVSFLATAFKESKKVRLDLGGKAVESNIEALRRSKENDYLVAVIEGTEHFVSSIRVID